MMSSGCGASLAPKVDEKSRQEDVWDLFGVYYRGRGRTAYVRGCVVKAEGWGWLVWEMKGDT